MVLASLLAVSLTVPSFAGVTSANVGENSTSVIAAPINAVASTATTLANGEYEIVPTMTKGMNSHFAEPAKLIVENGQITVQLLILEKSNKMVDSLQSERNGELVEMDTVEGDQTTATRTVSFPVEKLGEVINAHVVVNVPPNPAMPDGAVMPHDFEITVNAPVVTEEVAVTVYKDGTAEESIMKNYIAANVEITKNVVTMTFPQGQYIQSFQVAGKDATLVSEDEVSNERKYSFEVSDLSKLIDADIHIIVNEAGVSYDSKHKIQFGFDVKGAQKPIVNPFTDIDKDGNKAAILALYDKGIVKGQDKFNPRNNITRSQFALMVARALDLKSTESAGFKDLANITDKERVDAINALAEAGIVKKGDKFNPDNTLTRQQGALMLYRAVTHVAGQEINMGDTSLSYYTDGAVVTDEEAKKAFALLYAGGVMTGSPTADGKKVINANSPLLRTQMAKILHGSLEFMEQ